MTGLTPPTSGRATILGQTYRELHNPGRQVGVMLDASAQHPGRTGREVLRVAADLGRRLQVPGRGGARARRPHRRGGGPPGPQLLPRHAPAPRHRRGAPRRAAGADPRRAGQRPRPAGHPLDARAAAPLRRRRRHRAAVQPPAARGADRRRRPGHDRPRPHRGDGLQGGAAQPRRHHGPAPPTTPAWPRCSSGRRPGDPHRLRPRRRRRARASSAGSPPAERVVLLELRSGGSEGLEEMFLGLTAATSREGDAA